MQDVTQATVLLCSGNSLRWGLWIGAPFISGTTVAIATSATTLIQTGGFPLSNPATGPAVVSPFSQQHVRDWGVLTQQPWYGGIPGGGLPSAPFTWTVLEILLVPGGPLQYMP